MEIGFPGDREMYVLCIDVESGGLDCPKFQVEKRVFFNIRVYILMNEVIFQIVGQKHLYIYT